jgi:hypothetical protein
MDKVKNIPALTGDFFTPRTAIFQRRASFYISIPCNSVLAAAQPKKAVSAAQT